MRPRTMRLISLLAIITASLLPSIVAAGVGDLHPTTLPYSLISLDETVTITWLEHTEAELHYGPSALEIDNEVILIQSMTSELQFSPGSGGMSPGVWAARLVAGNDSSLPFYLIVESESVAAMTLPQNGSEITGASTLLAWEPVLSVPYYHVLISDQAITIDEDENGDTLISGANIIWQAITSATSIEYGALDPSGFFDELNGTPPPLAAGTEYNWVVLNNYGNSPALSSSKQAGVSAFSVEANVIVDAPQLTQPAPFAVLEDETITFEWDDVPEAAHFHFYLSRIISDDDSQGSIPVFDQVTTGNLIDLPTASMLIDSPYQWKVFALDEQGQGNASDTREFNFHTAIGTLSIRTVGGSGAILPYADVELEPIGGGGSAIPILTDSGGTYDEDYTPGGYRLTASKTGFEDGIAEVVINDSQTTHIILALEESEAFLAGQVLAGGQPQAYATVTATDDASGSERTVQTANGGDFMIGLSSGNWTISASKPGYHFDAPIATSITPGEYVTLGSALILEPNSSTLSGAVLSEGGQPIVAATVTLSGAGGTQAVMTGANVLYQLSLEAGSWLVSVTKVGYLASSPRTIDIQPGEDIQLDPPFTLGSAAAILSGFVRANGNIVAGASVTATPGAGSSYTTNASAVGGFQFSLMPGTWTLTVAATGYSPVAPIQVTLEGGESQAGIELLLEANPSTVSGIVSDGQNAISSATVSNGSTSTQTNPDGSYTLSLPAGTQVLQAWREYYAGASQTLDIAPGQLLTGVDFILAPDAATVSGHVTSDGTAVAGALVTLSPEVGEPISRLSDYAGEFTISVQAGNYTLSAAKDGMLESDGVAVILAAGQVLSNNELTLVSASIVLGGMVTAGGSPLREARIDVSSGQATATTNTGVSGTWTLVLPAGSAWQVEASKSGYSSASAATPELAAGETWDHDFQLSQQAALMVGTVSDDDEQLVGGATLVFTRSGSDWEFTANANGYYSAALEPGDYSLQIAVPGYASLGEAVTLAAGTQERDFLLATRFASLSGFVNTSGGSPLAGAALQAVGEFGSGSATSGQDGAYVFPRLIAGNYEFTVSLPGHEGTTSQITFAENESAEQDWILGTLVGVLAGSVSDGSGAAVAGVNLQVRDATGVLIAQAQSDAAGDFSLGSLPPESVSVTASKSGYHVRQPNPINDLVPSQSDLSFILDENTGIIRGTVRDPQQTPISDILVRVNDGDGYFGSATSGIDGAFEIGTLRLASEYVLVADAPGWAETQVAGISPNGSSVNVTMVAAVASVMGTLAAAGDTSELPDGSMVKAIPNDASGLEVSQALGSAGVYSLTGLRPGVFTVLFFIDGFLTEPRSMTVTIAEGDEVANLDFTLVAAAPADLTIEGEDEIDNDGSYLYRGAMTTSEGERVDYPLLWSVTPEWAGVVDPVSGRFEPSDSYIGEATLDALHESTGLGGSQTLSIFARLSADFGQELEGGAGMRLSVPAGAVSQTVRVSVVRLTPASVKRNAGDYRVDGQLYHFVPDGLGFTDENEPTLTLPIPETVTGSNLAMGWWDPTQLDWEILSARKVGSELQRNLEHFSDYVLLVANDPLAVANAVVRPNPFSPHGMEGGGQIAFTLQSQDMTQPVVDIEIFNMLGDPVRTLIENAPMPLGAEQTVLWNGETDDGNVARNGRYIVRITAKDSTGDQTVLIQAILIK